MERHLLHLVCEFVGREASGPRSKAERKDALRSVPSIDHSGIRKTESCRGMEQKHLNACLNQNGLNGIVGRSEIDELSPRALDSCLDCRHDAPVDWSSDHTQAVVYDALGREL